MIGIVCLEERRGMQFGGRRVSRDRVVTEKICELCEGKTLWMNPASEKLFAEQKESGKVTLQAAADFLEQAGEGEYCFVENTGLQAVEAKIEKSSFSGGTGIIRLTGNSTWIFPNGIKCPRRSLQAIPMRK